MRFILLFLFLSICCLFSGIEGASRWRSWISLKRENTKTKPAKTEENVEQYVQPFPWEWDPNNYGNGENIIWGGQIGGAKWEENPDLEGANWKKGASHQRRSSTTAADLPHKGPPYFWEEAPSEGYVAKGVRFASQATQWVIGEELYNRVAKLCNDFVTQAKAEIHDRLTFLFGPEKTAKIEKAFSEVNWIMVGPAMFKYYYKKIQPDSKEFKNAMKNLKHPMEKLADEMSTKEYYSEIVAERSQNLEFMNALVQLIFANFLPFGLGMLITDTISKPIAYHLIISLHPKMKNKKKEALKVQVKEENHNVVSMENALSIFYKNVNFRAFFLAMFKNDTEGLAKEMRPVLEKMKEQIGQQESIENAVQQAMHKILALKAPWIIVLFKKTIDEKIGILAKPIANAINEKKMECERRHTKN